MALKEGKMKRVVFKSNDIGVMLLESITKGLYHNPLNSVREYVQNEYDAGATQVKILTSGDTLKIIGDGRGMSQDELYDAKRMGFSSKTSGEDVGFRGIGIWSGVAICDEILVITKRKEDTFGYALKIDAKGLRQDMEDGRLSLIEALSERVFSRSLDRAEYIGKKGTSVELRKILGCHLEALSGAEMAYYVQQILPVKISPEYPHSKLVEEKLKAKLPGYRTIRIHVNDREIFRPPVTEADAPPPVFQELKDNDNRVFAYSWYLAREDHRVSDESKFIIYKCKGFTVGDTSRSNVMVLREADRGAHTWATGEIHVIHDDIVPTSERVEFETNEAYVVFESLVTSLLDDVVKRVRDNERNRLAKGRVQKATDFKLRFQETNDMQDRIDLLYESGKLVRRINNDLKTSKIDATVKVRLEAAGKLLHKDIGYMARNLGTPLDDLDESAESKPKRKTRRSKPKKVEELDVEDQVGEIASAFSLDMRSRRLLAAVMKALHKTLNGNEKQIKAFIDNLKDALKSRTKDDSK